MPRAVNEPLPLTVLVVDDDPLVRRMGSRLLRRLVKRVIEAEDGEQALAHLEEESVDLILTDLSMPRMNGIELAHAVRARWPDIPLVLVTAFDTPEVHALLEEGVFSGFLPKPTPLPKLREQLSQYAPRAADA